MSTANEPAYPPTESPWRVWANPGVNDAPRECLGMTTRQVIAKDAMKGILANASTRGDGDALVAAVARMSVKFADALLAELERTEKP